MVDLVYKKPHGYLFPPNGRTQALNSFLIGWAAAVKSALARLR